MAEKPARGEVSSGTTRDSSDTNLHPVIVVVNSRRHQLELARPRMLDLANNAPSDGLRVLERLLNVVDRREGEASASHLFDPFGGGVGGEDLVDEWEESGAVVHSGEVIRVEGVGGEVGTREDLAELQELRVCGQGQVSTM